MDNGLIVIYHWNVNGIWLSLHPINKHSLNFQCWQICSNSAHVICVLGDATSMVLPESLISLLPCHYRHHPPPPPPPCNSNNNNSKVKNYPHSCPQQQQYKYWWSNKFYPGKRTLLLIATRITCIRGVDPRSQILWYPGAWTAYQKNCVQCPNKPSTQLKNWLLNRVVKVLTKSISPGSLLKHFSPKTAA